MKRQLVEALDAAKARAEAGGAKPDEVAEVLERVLTAAAASPEVAEALRDVPAGHALLRFTDAPLAFSLDAGEGRLRAERVEPKGAPGPKVDASSETWLGLLGGTLRPWLAFTRGAVVARAGLTELRWMQTVAERLQRAYAEARAAG